jgi:hypothetical protein
MFYFKLFVIYLLHFSSMIYVERSFSQILIEYIRIVYLLSDDLRSDSFSKDSSLNPQASNHIIKYF